MSNPYNRKYPNPGTELNVVMKGMIDELYELKAFRDFVLQDPKMQEQWEQYKTFRILKDNV